VALTDHQGKGGFAKRSVSTMVRGLKASLHKEPSWIAFSATNQYMIPKDMNKTTNNALILSLNVEASPNTFRVSLKWQGNHDIADFDLERFGKVLSLQDETENTGWAIIERPFRAAIAHTLPGWAIHESIRPLNPGDTVPLRPDRE
jgi:hypothetical protein